MLRLISPEYLPSDDEDLRQDEDRLIRPSVMLVAYIGELDLPSRELRWVNALQLRELSWGVMIVFDEDFHLGYVLSITRSPLQRSLLQ